MRTGAVAGAADITDNLAFFHILSCTADNTAHMTICCLIAIIMVYTCINSITAIPACLLYIACCTGINRLAIISGNINTRMPVTAITAKGISATAERR